MSIFLPARIVWVRCRPLDSSGSAPGHQSKCPSHGCVGGGRRTFDRRCQPRLLPPPLAKGPASRSNRACRAWCQRRALGPDLLAPGYQSKCPSHGCVGGGRRTFDRPAAPSPPAARQRACKQKYPDVEGEVRGGAAEEGGGHWWPTTNAGVGCAWAAGAGGGRRTLVRRYQPRPRPPALADRPASGSTLA